MAVAACPEVKEEGAVNGCMHDGRQQGGSRPHRTLLANQSDLRHIQRGDGEGSILIERSVRARFREGTMAMSR